MTAFRIVAVPVLLALLLASCGSDGSEPAASLPEPDAAPPSAPVELAGDTVVFVWTETGGCAMGGPNCARYEVTVDGTVETFRLGIADEDTAEAATTGQVDPALVQAWRTSLIDEDIDALRERAGVGELTAAFDGVDIVVADPTAGVELSSVATNFDQAEPVFAAAVALAAAAAAAAPLDIEMR